MLTVLTLVPVSGTLCAALCLPAAPSVSEGGQHHAAPPPCHEPVSEQPRVHPTPGHACDCHVGPAREATGTLTAAARHEHGIPSVTQLESPGTTAPRALTTDRRSRSGPPGSPRSTRAPLVLRI